MKKNLTLNRRERRLITLLEVIIALVLLGVLLSALFGYYRYMEVLSQKMGEQRQENFRILYAQYRLAQILPKIQFNHPLGEKFHKYILYTSKDGQGAVASDNDSLVFVYDNGIKADPLYANTVIGRLYRDSENRLILATWPSLTNKDENPPMLHEILLEKVEKLEFAFYVPPYKEDKPKPAGKQKTTELINFDLYGRWHKHGWSLGEPTIPALLQVIVTANKKEYTFAFVLGQTSIPIIYSDN